MRVIVQMWTKENWVLTDITLRKYLCQLFGLSSKFNGLQQMRPTLLLERLEKSGNVCQLNSAKFIAPTLAEPPWPQYESSTFAFYQTYLLSTNRSLETILR